MTGPPDRGDAPGAEPASVPPGVALHAAATGFLSGMPVPWLDMALAGLARGAAMRRVAARHGVRLTREARDILAASAATGSTGSAPVRLLRAVASRVTAPLRFATRLEDGLAALLGGMLLDHYLHTSGREQGAPISGAEARRVRRAMDVATRRGALRAVGGWPGHLWEASKSAAQAALAADDEDRNVAERLTDTFLDGVSELPTTVVTAVTAAFDEALES